MLIDGGLFANNPSELAIDEVNNIWGYERKIDIMVSIGNGLKSSVSGGENFFKFMNNEVVDLAFTSLQVENNVSNFLRVFIEISLPKN